jgi:hypothetical protein
MATISFTESPLETGARALTVQWLSLGNGDDGQAYTSSFFPDKSIQIGGNFGGGSTIILEGSNVPTPGAGDWAQLHNPQGDLLSFTVAGIDTVLENARHMRPRVTAGDGTTDLNAYVLFSSSARR